MGDIAPDAGGVRRIPPDDEITITPARCVPRAARRALFSGRLARLLLGLAYACTRCHRQSEKSIGHCNSLIPAQSFQGSGAAVQVIPNTRRRAGDTRRLEACGLQSMPALTHLFLLHHKYLNAAIACKYYMKSLQHMLHPTPSGSVIW